MVAERNSVLHSWCAQSQWNAPTVVGGAGAHLHLEDGRSILDMSSLAECSNLGHQHPRVVAAIRAQAERLCFVTNAWGAQPRADLAERLLELSGFEGGRVFFTLGGADANEHAVKIVRQALGKPRGVVIARDRSYHGSTHLAMALSGDTRTRAMVDPDAMRVSHVAPPYAYRCPFDSSDDAECGERAAAAIAASHRPLRSADASQPLSSSPMPAPMASSRRTATGRPCVVTPPTRGIPLIADEVMSGFGRCGEWFAWQRYGAAGQPDIITLAKGLTGAALPLGAVVVSREIAARLENEVLCTGLTYCGHPLACAAGLAAIEAYQEEHLIERSRRLGAGLRRDLERLAEAACGHRRRARRSWLVRRARTGRRPRYACSSRTLAADTRAAQRVVAGGHGRRCLVWFARQPDADRTAAGDHGARPRDALALLDRLLTRFFPAEASPDLHS